MKTELIEPSSADSLTLHRWAAVEFSRLIVIVREAGLRDFRAMTDKKTWVKKQTERLENHPVWGRILLGLSIVGLFGGIITIGEKSFQFYKFLTREDPELRITLNVRNARKTDIDLNPICSFSLTETLGNSFTVYSGFGEYLRLSPIGRTGTNIYHLKAGESRNYFVNFPSNQEARDLLARGATTIKFTSIPVSGGVAEGTIAFQKEVIRKEKALIEIKP